MKNKSNKKEKPPKEIEVRLEDQFLSKKEFITRKKLVEILFGAKIKELHKWGKFDSPQKAFSNIDYNGTLSSITTREPGITQEQINAGRAYKNFSKWIAIAFQNKTGREPDIFPQFVTYPMGKLFKWIEDEEIFQKFKLLGFEVPERAKVFIGNVQERNASSKEPEKSNAKPRTKKPVVKKPEITAEPSKKKTNKGGNPGVDPHGEIAEKINTLKLAGVKDGDIPWDIRFTKFVQKLKKDKIKTGYLNVKVHRRVKKADYTKAVGISLDTVEKIIKNSSN